MAFTCPDCRDKTLSVRTVELRICLKCGRVIGVESALELLRRLGVQQKVITKVRNDLLAQTI